MILKKENFLKLLLEIVNGLSNWSEMYRLIFYVIQKADQDQDLLLFIIFITVEN